MKLYPLALFLFFVPTLAMADAAISFAESLDRHLLADTQRCPADTMLPASEEAPFHAMNCDGKLQSCLIQCNEGNGNACYALASTLQNSKADPLFSQVFFQRACERGITSGCTNRAAGLLTLGPGKDDKKLGAHCVARTFDEACRRDDPWGCTMRGDNLIEGYGVAKDLHGARQALARSCRFGDDDPACQYAKRLLRMMDKMEENTRQ